VKLKKEIKQIRKLDKYDDLENDIKFLNEFSLQKKRADFAGFITFDDDDDEIFTFGKYRGKKVIEILEKDKGYYSWIQNADFPLYTKKVLGEIKERNQADKKTNSLEDLKNKFNQKL